MIFAQYENDWRQVLRFLISLFEDDALDITDKNTEYTWGVRAIALQVAQQIPFSFFDIGLVNDSKVSQEDRYFLRDDPTNPALQNETPLVQFWLMCASMFDHPWTMLFNEFLEESPILCIQEMKLKVIEGFPNDKTNKVEIHKGVKTTFDPEYKDSEEEDDPAGYEDNGLVNKHAQPNGWDSDDPMDYSADDRRKDMEWNNDDANNSDNGGDRDDDDDDNDDDDHEDEGEYDDNDNDELSQESVILVEGTRQMMDNEDEADNANPCMNTDEAVSELTGDTVADKDPKLASLPRKKGRSHRVSLQIKVTVIADTHV